LVTNKPKFLAKPWTNTFSRATSDSLKAPCLILGNMLTLRRRLYEQLVACATSWGGGSRVAIRHKHGTAPHCAMLSPAWLDRAESLHIARERRGGATA
jgi:hypothetical protein